LGPDFVLPKPREQSSQDLLNKGHYISESKESKRKKNSLKKHNDISKVFRHLLHAIFRGDSGPDLTKKIEDADGLQTLLYLRLRIAEKAAHNKPDSDAEFPIHIEFSLLHLAVIENKPKTFLTMLEYMKSYNVDIIEVMMNSKLYVDAVDAAIDHLRYEDVFMHGQNVIHLATEYSQECLEHLCFGPFDEIANHLDDNDHFKNTSLHLAASNVTSDCASKILDAVDDVKKRSHFSGCKREYPVACSVSKRYRRHSFSVSKCCGK